MTDTEKEELKNELFEIVQEIYLNTTRQNSQVYLSRKVDLLLTKIEEAEKRGGEFIERFVFYKNKYPEITLRDFDEHYTKENTFI